MTTMTHNPTHHETVAGSPRLRIAITDTVYGYRIYYLPALVGRGVMRTTGKLRVAMDGGYLYALGYWDEHHAIAEGGMLRGWGKLDGDSYQIGGANVPKRVIEHIRKHHGMIN